MQHYASPALTSATNANRLNVERLKQEQGRQTTSRLNLINDITPAV